MQIHIEPVGGLSGDMFIAAMVDAFPELQKVLKKNLQFLKLPRFMDVTFEKTRNRQMDGMRFIVSASGSGLSKYSKIKKFIDDSDIEPAIKIRAIDIFEVLAIAESRVHGVEMDDVTFHEVGNWDSIIDIIFAGIIIEYFAGANWSVGPIPLGEGLVDSQHGLIPVPAPATTFLLKAFSVYRDGIKGERITPTGAAILKYLSPSQTSGLTPMKLESTGVGFGAKIFENISNITRILTFSYLGGWDGENLISVIRFDVDDQSPEDLALGLDNIRRHEGVLDLVQFSAIGKKSRMSIRIEVLTKPQATNPVIEECLKQTNTLGVRWCLENRSTLGRQKIKTKVDGKEWSVKLANRPTNTLSAKVEADELAAGMNFREREDHRATVEKNALRGRKSGNERRK